MHELRDASRPYPRFTLRQLGTVLTTGPFGTVLAAADYLDGGIPVINPSHIVDGAIVPDSTISVSEATSRRLARHRLQLGDVVLGRKGDVGRSAIVTAREEGWICGSDSIAIHTRRDRLTPEFLQWVTASGPFRHQLLARSNGSTMDGINEPTLLGTLVPCPSIEQQAGTSRYLEREVARIDRSVSIRRRQSKALGERFEALTELWVDNLRVKYGSVTLKRLSAGIEQGWSPECEAVAAEPDEWGVLKTSAVSTGRFLAAENKRLPKPAADLDRWAVKDGDLLVVRGSGSPSAVAQACVAATEGRKLLLSDLLYRVRLVEADPRFAAHVLRSRFARAQFEASIRTDVGMTRKIRSEDLANILVPNVPYRLQREAVADLEQAVSGSVLADELNRRQIDLLLERRQALITAAVTGQLEIPGVAA